MKSYGLVIAGVTEFIVTVITCLFLGKEADRYLGTGYKLLAAGTVLGFLIGMIRLAINLKKIMEKPDDGP